MLLWPSFHTIVLYFIRLERINHKYCFPRTPTLYLTITNYGGGHSNSVLTSCPEPQIRFFGSGGWTQTSHAKIRANPLTDLWRYYSEGSGRWSLADRLLALAGSGGPAGPSGRHFHLPSWNSLVQNAAVTVRSLDQGAVFFSESPIVLLCRSQRKDRTACTFITLLASVLSQCVLCSNREPKWNHTFGLFGLWVSWTGGQSVF